jgi:hypothetical protein
MDDDTKCVTFVSPVRESLSQKDTDDMGDDNIIKQLLFTTKDCQTPGIPFSNINLNFILRDN